MNDERIAQFRDWVRINGSAGNPVEECLDEIERLERLLQTRIQTLSTLECVIDDILEVADRATAVKKAHTEAFLQEVKGELPWLKREDSDERNTDS